VHSVPGPSALTAALSVAGFPGKDVLYKGFLSLKGKQRKDELNEMRDFPGIIVFYEAPHRVLVSLEDLVAAGMGPRRCVCCREITKRHESVYRGSVNDCFRAAKIGKSDEDSSEGADAINIRGEFVFVLGPSECRLYSDEPVFRSGGQQRQDSEARTAAVTEALMKLHEDGIQRSEAVRIVCDTLNLPKSTVYAVALSIDW
jgi:16S rRNA (cytidine1402-2'-O)-methyltransferase